MVIYIILAFVVGLIIGGVTIRVVDETLLSKPVGTLRVDQSDQYDEPYLFLMLHNEDAYDIMKRKQVVLDVEVKDFISRN